MSIEPSTTLSHLLQSLSAYPLKLFLYLCALAGSPDREIEIRFGKLSEVLKRGETSVGKDMDEIRLKGMCMVVAQANQHRMARVTIPREHWPAGLFEGGASVPSSSMQRPELAFAADGEPANSGIRRDRENFTACNADDLHTPSKSPVGHEEAFNRLARFGIHPLTARAFISTMSPERIVDTIEYIEFRAGVPGSKIHSPQGMLIHYLRESVPLPSSFISTRQLQAKREAEELQETERRRIQSLECEYDEWCINRSEQELQRRYSEQEVDVVLEDIVRSLQSVYSQMPRMTNAVQKDVARRHLLKTIRAELHIPSFREWCETYNSESHSETVPEIWNTHDAPLAAESTAQCWPGTARLASRKNGI